jgi:pimeloyl-ACP methyl ester carboxylesterase
MSEIKVPGARLRYTATGSGPVLLMIPGAMMDARDFAGVAPLLAGRYTVVTYDPRGTEGGRLDGPPQDVPVEVSADDAHRLLLATGDGPAYVFGTSAGALAGLDLAVRYPWQVRVLVAHEPPLAGLLPGDDPRRGFPQEVHEAYRADGPDAAMRLLAARLGLGGRGAGGQAATTPPALAQKMVVMRQNAEFCLAHVMPFLDYLPDLAALRAGSPVVLTAAGEHSAGQLPGQAARALASRLGTEPVVFPGGHSGFLSHPGAFAHALESAITAITSRSRH